MTEYFHKLVASIKFGLMSPSDLKKIAQLKIITPELYDKEGYPVDGGLMDIRLGVIDPGLRCKTCNGRLKECTGHFGYIELARPVVHVKYIKPLLTCLECTCEECGKLLLDENEIAKFEARVLRLEKAKNSNELKKLYKQIIKIAKGKEKCPYCNAEHILVKLDKPTSFMQDTKRLSPTEMLAWVKKISDGDSALLGIAPANAKPEWMVLTLFPIPPVTMRPSITLDTGERAEDDLTHKLSDIVRINQRLFENLNAGAPEVIIEDLWDLLQYHITTFFDNSIPQIPPARHRSGQPLKTVTERIKSKEGRFRHNLVGKRVNFAARTVISPDPRIEFNEVGVPVEVAKELTMPERVNEWNIDWLKKFVEYGPMKHPGANYVITQDGKKKRISAETQELILKEFAPGDIVERHIINGDIALLNRQPSLHRMSIMCHRVKVLPGKSFKLNPGVCNPYNADFDGDEMNLHIPQGEEAQAEAELLMEVQTQIISPKHGLNLIGCIEDAITGNYLLTNQRTCLPKAEAVSLLISIGVDNEDAIRQFKDTASGKEVFSAVLPNNINFVAHSKNCQKCKECLRRKCPYDAYVFIQDGVLKCGTIDSNIIGDSGGTLLRDIHRMYDKNITVKIFGRIFRLGIAYLTKRGFTIKTADADLPEPVSLKIKQLIEQGRTEVDEIIADYRQGKIKPLAGRTIEESCELFLLQKLNEVRNKVGKLIAKSISDQNNFLVMARSGAVGSTMHLAQTAALVGQQALRGKRIVKGYKNRTLSLFRQFDLGPEAHGFVRHSYKKGINPVEFYFHSMTGRDSLMDTALRTPKSGYLYRRLVNALQDLKIEYDYTVRNAGRGIVQFKYGDDEIDVSKSEAGTIDIRKIVDEVVG